MKDRCYNPTNPAFHLYGGRGITVDARWLGSFETFLADMGRRPEGTSIDRIDNDGNYEPGNCRWATATQQANNQRRTVRVEYMGESTTLREVARREGVPYMRLWKLYRRHAVTVEVAVERAKAGHSGLRRYRRRRVLNDQSPAINADEVLHEAAKRVG